MSIEDKLEVVAAGALGILVAWFAPKFPSEVGVVAWLSYLAFIYAFGVFKLRRKWGNQMSLLTVLLVGWGFITLMSVIVWYGFKPNAEPAVATDSDPAALVLSKSAGPTMVIMSPLIPDPNQKPADPSDLEFYFFALTAAAFGDKIQYAEATVTNRSPRKMHLEIWGQVDYWKDSGEAARLGLRAEWNPEGLKEGTGQDFIDLDAWETKKGRLLLSLGKPEDHGLSKWFLDASENVYFDVFDSVTGKRIAFKGTSGYPLDQMPAPLPSHKHLLALEFPKPPAPDSQSDSTPETLDLLLRTRGQGYYSGKLDVSALFTNNSPDHMELSVNLLICDPPDGTSWQSREGLIKVNGVKGSPGEKTVNVDPGATVEWSLAFDLADLLATKPEGWQLSGLPKENLLEISDRVSGKRVWCAVRPGYPPGTDMRSLPITRNQVANTDISPTGEAKDSE